MESGYGIIGDQNKRIKQDSEGRIDVNINSTDVPDTPQEIDKETINRLRRPTAIPKGLLDPEVIDNPAQLVPMQLGMDGYYYGARPFRGNLIFRSNDGFASYETGPNFSTIGNGHRPQSVHKTKDGYVVITESQIFFSDTFGSGYTPTLTLPEGSPGFAKICIDYRYSGVGKDVFLVGEYSSMKNTPHNLYISLDSGQTWSLTLSTIVVDETTNCHWHHAISDPYSGNLYAANGDGPDNRAQYISEDNGETWTAMTEENYYQPTFMLPFSDRIVISPDSNVMMSQYNLLKRSSGLTGGNEHKMELGISIDEKIASSAGYATRPAATLNANEAYIVHPALISQPGAPAYIVATGDGGNTWHNVYGVKMNKGAVRFHEGIVGVDETGHFYAYFRYDGEYYILKFKSIEWIYK